MISRFIFLIFISSLININCDKKNDLPIISIVTLNKSLELGGYSAPPEKSFYQIGDIIVDQADNIVVADMGNVRIQKFDSQGNYLQTIGKQGRGPGELGLFFYFEMDKCGNLYVADASNARIQKFSPSGKYLKSLNVAFHYGADFEVQDEKIFFRKQYMKDHLLLETDTSLSYIKPIIPANFSGHKEFINMRGINYSFTVTPKYEFIFFNNFTKRFYIFNYDGNLLKEFELKNQELQNYILEDIERLNSRTKNRTKNSKIVIDPIGSMVIFPNIKFYNNFIYCMYLRITHQDGKFYRHSILYIINMDGHFLKKYIGFENSWHTFTLDSMEIYLQ